MTKIVKTKAILSFQEKRLTPENCKFYDYSWQRVCYVLLCHVHVVKNFCLAPMAEENTSLLGTPFTMSVDLRGYGCTTGVSAFDRSSTIKALVAGNLNPSEFARPGHVFPLYGAENGVLERNGHTEATLDMTRMAGLNPGRSSC